jgi:NAD(P)H dehydrogenase (quinone)
VPALRCGGAPARWGVEARGILRAMARLIGVTGATGAVGGHVAARLAEAGALQRLVVRDPARAPLVVGAEVRAVPGYADGVAMTDALQGVHTLFLVPAAEAADRIDQHRAAVTAAAAAGVERIVYLSFFRASPDATFVLVRHHFATEEAIRATGLRFTFLRMNMYLDFLPAMVSADGVIAGPAGDGRLGGVLRRDVGDVAAAVLADDAGHDGRVYEITGRELLTLAEAAETMSRATGQRVVFRDETVEEAYASRAGLGPDWEVEGWVTSYTGIAAGELDGLTDTVKRLTGREPGTLAEWLGEHPDALAHVRTP